jgi:putative ABC transport system substrate-binding protein
MKCALLVLAFLGAIVLSNSEVARADAPVPVVGTLTISLTDNPIVDGFREGMRDLGYVEGRNIKTEDRGAGGQVDRLAQLARELAERKVNVIVAFNTSAARAAMEASDAPVVFVASDPVGSGLAANLSKPGGNATGVSLVATELTSKRLELLRQLLPGARRIGFLSDIAKAPGMHQFQEVQKTAQTLGIQLLEFNSGDSSQLDEVLHKLTRSHLQALIIGNDPVLYANRRKLAKALQASKLPAVFPYRASSEHAVLLSYGADLKMAGRKMAAYVDKILKGERPAQLPIEQISKFELIIDLRVARALALKVPEEVLQRADEVIQ